MMNNIIAILQDLDSQLAPAQVERIREKLTSMLNYRPRIGVFGKTGVGKSSLCNALFGKPICAISDIEACTRDPQEVMLNMENGKGITLLDVPGVGENLQRDEEYSELYRKLLPELDMVLWVLKADDRAYSVDIEFYTNVVKPHLQQGKPFILVLNQVDKIEPFRDWDGENRKPGPSQAQNIALKAANVATHFQVKQSLVVPVSADEKFGLTKLVDEIIFSLPDEKKVSIAREVPAENLSTESKAEVKNSLSRVLTRTLTGVATGAALGSKIAGKAGAVVGGVIGGIGGFLGLW
ncbi:GTPase Era [Shewanella putrefaciens]|nr:GTPase Era [Shewanella putrefaciens]